MAKAEVKSGTSNPSSKKETEKLAAMESHDIPMSEYVKSKDENDYKKGTFSTSKYADSNYSDDVKKYQAKLNEEGITDKIGDTIDEDGLWGAQTASATKKLVEKSENPTKENNLAKEIFKEFSDTISNFGDLGKGGYMSNYFSPTEIDENTFFAKVDKKHPKQYSIKFGKKDTKSQYNIFNLMDRNFNSKNGNRIFGIDTIDPTKNTGKDGARIKEPHYNVIVDAYTKNELDKVAKRLGYENSNTMRNANIENIPQNIHLPLSNSTLQKTAALKKANKVLDATGKAMFWLEVATDTAKIGTTIYDDIVDNNNQIDKKTVSTISGVSGSWAGAALGASAGAKAGAVIGTAIFPGPGTAIGGALGSAIGGAVGAMCGEKGASWISEQIYDQAVD